MRRDLGGISPKVLTQRLRAMESQGLVSWKTLPTSPAQVEYRLTAFGHAFEPVLAAMIKVAEKVHVEHEVRYTWRGHGGRPMGE